MLARGLFSIDSFDLLCDPWRAVNILQLLRPTVIDQLEQDVRIFLDKLWVLHADGSIFEIEVVNINYSFAYTNKPFTNILSQYRADSPSRDFNIICRLSKCSRLMPIF